MSALLQYEFQILHADRVNAALAANRASFRRHNQQMAADAATAARRTGGAAARVTPPAGWTAAARAAQREPERVASYWNRAAQRSADYRIRQEAMVARAQARHAEQTAKAQERAQARAARDAAKEKSQQERRSAREIARQQEQSQRYWDRVRRASLDQRLREEAQQSRTALNAARQGRLANVGRMYDRVSGVGSSAFGALAGVGRAALGATTIGGGFAIAGAIGGIMERYRLASGLATQAGTPELTSRIAEEAGQVKGISAIQDLGALERWVTLTGKLQMGREQLQEWGKLALATNSQVEDLASGAGEAFAGLGEVITDDAQKLRVVQSIMRSAAGMGAVGSVEIKDLASRMGQVWASAVQFGGDPEQRMNQMMGIAQIIRPTAGSVDEAVTSIQRLPDDLMQRQERIKNVFGVDIWEKGKKGKVMRQAPEILTDIIQATEGRKDLLKDKMFDIRAFRAVRPLAEIWNTAESEEKGTGRREVMKRIEYFTSQKRTTEQIEKLSSQRFAEDPSLQMAELWKNTQMNLGKALLPEVMKLAPEIAKLAPAMATAAKATMDLAQFFIKNPFTGIGALIAGMVVKDLAAAAVGDAIKRVLVAQVATQAGISEATTAAKGGLTQVAASANSGSTAIGKFVLGLGVAAVSIGAIAAVAEQLQELKKETGGGKTDEELSQQARTDAVKSGRILSEEQAKKANAFSEKDEQKRTMEQQFAATMAAGMFGGPGMGFVPTPVGNLPTVKPGERFTGADIEYRESALEQIKSTGSALPDMSRGEGFVMPTFKDQPDEGRTFSTELLGSASEIGKAIGEAAVAEIKKANLGGNRPPGTGNTNRGNTPSAPTT